MPDTAASVLCKFMERDYSWSTYKVGTPCCAGIGMGAVLEIAGGIVVDDLASLIAK